MGLSATGGLLEGRGFDTMGAEVTGCVGRGFVTTGVDVIGCVGRGSGRATG